MLAALRFASAPLNAGVSWHFVQRLLTSYWGTVILVAIVGVLALVLFDDPPSESMQLKTAVLIIGALIGTTIGHRLSSHYALGRRFSKSSVAKPVSG